MTVGRPRAAATSSSASSTSLLVDGRPDARRAAIGGTGSRSRSNSSWDTWLELLRSTAPPANCSARACSRRTCKGVRVRRGGNLNDC
eukprot:363516-Chlamydomonas_euryale.AAC.28